MSLSRVTHREWSEPVAKNGIRSKATFNPNRLAVGGRAEQLACLQEELVGGGGVPAVAEDSPRPIAWVSTIAPDGARNLAPFSFFGAFSFDRSS